MSTSRNPRGLSWETTGLCALLLFAGAGFEWPDLALCAAILLAIAVYRCRQAALLLTLRSSLFVFPAVFAAWVVVRALSRYLAAPNETDHILEWTTYYLVASGLPALTVALMLDGNRRWIFLVLAVALAALLRAILAHCDLAQLRDHLAGERAYFGLGNASGLYIATAMLGLFLLVPWGGTHTALWRRWWVAGAIALVALLSLALFLQQNRTVLIAVLLVFSLIVWLKLRVNRANGGLFRNIPRELSYAVTLCLVVGLFAMGSGTFKQRFVEGFNAALGPLTGDVVQGSGGLAITARIDLWRLGWQNVIAHPLLGSGPGIVPELVRGDPLIGQFSHVHNLYLQLLVDFGLVGLILYSCVLVVLCRALFGENSRARMGVDLWLFAGGSLALFLLVNLTQIRIDDGHGMFYVTMLYALVLSGAVAGPGTGRGCRAIG